MANGKQLIDNKKRLEVEKYIYDVLDAANVRYKPIALFIKCTIIDGIIEPVK